jgi:cobalt/nickel transport system permease protein
MKRVLIGLLALAVVAGSFVAWFASSSPDGLEWSIEGVAGTPQLGAGESGAFGVAAALQERLSFLPDYGFRSAVGEASEEEASWPAVDPGTSVAGLVGGAITLLMAAAIGLLLVRRSSGESAVRQARR